MFFSLLFFFRFSRGGVPLFLATLWPAFGLLNFLFCFV